MTNKEKTQQTTTSEVVLQQQATAIIDFHALLVRTNQHFLFSKKFKKLSVQLANELGNLQGKGIVSNQPVS